LGEDALGRALDLSRAGVGAEELGAWMEACGAGSPPVERARGGLRVRIEALSEGAGVVGWLLTCRPGAA
ncbi:MAG TPA: hypothetical protein VHH36_01670, partial [Candidatus Thermoplasmatota archaeon]|nr:hypothetical protein [Candidatus Thermoplasmatota archaeon]